MKQWLTAATFLLSITSAHANDDWMTERTWYMVGNDCLAMSPLAIAMTMKLAEQSIGPCINTRIDKNTVLVLCQEGRPAIFKASKKACEKASQD